jgi:hypothetical protein
VEASRTPKMTKRRNQANSHGLYVSLARYINSVVGFEIPSSPEIQLSYFRNFSRANCFIGPS